LDAELAASLWLCQLPKNDRYGYRDSRQKRHSRLVLLGAGDTRTGVPGIRDLLFGDAGACVGWDIEAIRDALERVREAEGRITAIEGQLAVARAELDRINARRLNLAVPDIPLSSTAQAALEAPPEEIVSLSNRELAILAVRMQQAHAELTRAAYDATTRLTVSGNELLDSRLREANVASSSIHRLRDAHARAVRDHDRAVEALERIRETGRTFPLPDDEPTTEELQDVTGDPDAVGLQHESWEAAIDRAGGIRRPLRRVRRYLNVSEVAWMFGVDPLRIRRWRAGQGGGAVGRAIQQARWVEEGPKLAFLDGDTIPHHLLMPGQVEALAHLLEHSMGSVVGGRRRSDSELDDAAA
jgi:hypothetical protein